MLGTMPVPDTLPHLILIRRLFWALVAADCLFIVFLGNIPSTGSDAAGNRMENGFAFLLQLFAFALLGLLSVLFIAFRAVAVRYVLIALVLGFCLTLMLLALFSFTS